MASNLHHYVSHMQSYTMRRKALIVKYIWIFELFFVLLVLSSGATIFHLVEWRRYFDALYFVVVTMTTIGYGDLVPQTELGRAFTMIYAIVGVPTFLAIAASILEARFGRRIKHYMHEVHREIRFTANELDQVEEQVEENTADIKEIKKSRLHRLFSSKK